MSGSRRRMNLNLTVDPPRTPRPQVSQPQSATVQYHYQPSSDNLVPHHRPATIPYAQQTSSWLSTHAQPTPFLLQAPYYATLPTSNVATPMPMPNPAANDYFVDRFITAITPLLSTHQQSTSARIDQIEAVLEKLSSHVKQVNVDAQAQTKQLAEAMQKAFLVQQAGGKALNSRMEKLEKAIKSSFDRDDTKSLLNRLETISFSVEELLERAKDPQADQFLPTATAVVPSKQYADASQNPIQRTPSPQPILVDRATSSVPQVYTDMAIGSDAPMPATPHQQTSALRRDFATSPVQHAYSSKGTDGRTPKTPRQFMSAGVATSPTTELPRLSMVISHRYSSDALTLVGDATCPENQSTVDLNELGVSPRLKRKQTKVARMTADEGDIEMERVEGAQGNTVLNNENSESQKGLKMSSLFTSSPAISRSLSAADWSDGTPHNAASDEGSDNDSALPAFRPATSPSVAKQYSVLKGERNSFDDGTVASLRHDALGDAHAGPKPSSPQLPIQPFCPRPSISPLPSPVSSPSPPPASVGRRPKFSKASDVGASPVVPGPSREAERSSLELQESASSPAQDTHLRKPAYDALVSSPAPVSSPAQEASVSSPGHTPQEINSADLQSSPHVSTDDLVPDSELSVTRMITETFESLEQLHAEVPEVGHSPLFLPDSPSPQPACDLGSPPPTPKQSIKAPQRRVVSLSSSPIATPKKVSPAIVSSIDGNTQNTKDPKLMAIKKPLLATLKPPAFAPIPTPAARPNCPPLKKIYVPSSPIYISSRSPSPLSELSDSEPGHDSDPDVRIIPPKKRKLTKGKAKVEPAAPPTLKAPRIDLKNKLLKLKTQDGPSAAVTRVKKRKVKESTLEAMEPPLKRARQKFEEEEEWRGNGKRPKKVAAEVAAQNGKGKEKEKEQRGSGSKEKSGTPASSTSTKGMTGRLRQRAPPTGCKWPTKNMTADKKFNQQFVECDVCFLWYHYGCVGIIDLKDVRIKGGELFTCPPCSAGGANPMVPSKNIVCARPDCGQEEKRSDEYFMTGIVGRSTKVQGGKGKRYIWLVKWDGYSIKDCTWEEEDGMSDPQSFIEDFNENASLEGFDPEADQHSTILLQEAIKGGWKDPNA